LTLDPSTFDESMQRELLALGAATLGESGAERMAPRVAAVWAGARVCGTAMPVHCTPGDNLAVHVAVTAAAAGAVLCVDVGDERALGYWGEVLTTAAEARGIAGLVIDGCVRDVDALEAHGFPVFSSGVALTGATKVREGTVGAPARVGDVDVHTGDVVVADRDGVVVIRAASLADVVDAGRTRAERERVLFDELRAGATTVDLLGLDPGKIKVDRSTM
jgi:4-hydroxy-4-methyl-2-oxoglutarate aldolase